VAASVVLEGSLSAPSLVAVTVIVPAVVGVIVKVCGVAELANVSVPPVTVPDDALTVIVPVIGPFTGVIVKVAGDPTAIDAGPAMV
jgi:hypothetical protein